jgi:hypothetical protein
MVKQFETISMTMSEPGADIDSLSSKMDRLQVGGCGCMCMCVRTRVPIVLIIAIHAC